jgi:hypothetical protein
VSWSCSRRIELSDIVKAVVSAAELGVDDPAAIALLLIQTAPTASTPLATESLPDAAKIAPPQPRLDDYVIAELKEQA